MIKPLQKNVLIKVHEIEQSAMLMVDKEDSQIEKATVLDIGDEVSLVKLGDVIYFKQYDIDKILDNNETFVLINEESIKALCTNTTTKK
jgi:co-chaperonin GroES (HSP10)